MNCPHCTATVTRKRAKKTKLGYTTFFCSYCRCTFNERTGTPFNFLEFPTDVVLLAVLWRLRCKLSLRGDTIRCVALEPLKQRHASVVTRDELRNYLRPRRTMGEVVSLLEQRRAFLQRLAALQTVIQAAS